MCKKQILALVLAGAMFFSGTNISYATENPVIEDILEDDSHEKEKDESADTTSSQEEDDLDGERPEEKPSDTSASEDDENKDAEEEESEEPETEFPEEELVKELSEEKASDSEELIEHPTGYVPAENQLPIIHNEITNGQEFLGGAIGSNYENKNLPPLKDQSPYGTCWAFATTGMEEINLLKNGIEKDLSELHLAYFAFNTVVDPLGGTDGDYYHVANNNDILNRGGNYNHALAILAQWMGAADEQTAKYDRDDVVANSVGLQDAIAFEDAVHVQNYYVENIDMATFRSNNDVFMLDPIKKMVEKTGAVGISFDTINGYSPTTSTSTYNSEHNCYYNPKPGGKGHAVVIVGWDDDFPKEYFPTQPPGDGAFLIRNSWTTQDASDVQSFAGYFWMSYYESTIRNDFYSVEVELADNYDNNYQYDGYPLLSSTETGGANVFTAHAESAVNGETLKAVSFYASATNFEYTIEIYTDVEDDPTSGTKVEAATVSGVEEFAGYHTIPLPQEVYLAPGTKFAVAVTLNCKALARENYFSSGDASASSKPGQSYTKVGDIWRDRGTSGNFSIKAFTCNVPTGAYVEPTDVAFTNVQDGKLTLSNGEVYKVTAKVLPETATDKNIIWSSSDESVAKVVDGQIEAVSAGEAVITASLLDGRIKRTIVLTVESKLLALAISTEQVFDLINGGSYIRYRASYSPKDYVPKEKIQWTSSDEEVLTIDENGRINDKMMGQSLVTASLEGITAQSTFTVRPSDKYFTYEVSDDKVLTVRWKAAKNAREYWISRGGSLKKFADDGSESYEFVDEYYKGSEATSTEYTFGPLFNGNGSALVTFTIGLGGNYTINYHLNGGTQNPENPLKYTAGNNYTLYKPTPPTGYVFSGWYTDPEYKKYIYSITRSTTGNLDLYARYTVKAPQLNVSSEYIIMSKGQSAQITAAYEPSYGSEVYAWKSYNPNLVKAVSNGNTCMLTAGNAEGFTQIEVRCNDLVRVINVQIMQTIWFDDTEVTVRSGAGETKELVPQVADLFKNSTIEWNSSDESILTVTGGIIDPADDLEEQHTVTVTASVQYGGKTYSAECLVTVLPMKTVLAPVGAVNGQNTEFDGSPVNKGAYFRLSTATEGASIYYTQNGSDPSIDDDGNPLDQDTLPYYEAVIIDRDIEIRAVAYKAGHKVSEVSRYEVTVVNDDWGDIIDEEVQSSLFADKSSNVPEGVWYLFRYPEGGFDATAYTASADIDHPMTYTSAKISFDSDIEVYHGTRRLVKGRDYTVSYKNNIKVALPSFKNAPTVLIKGKGSYTNTAQFKFAIEKESMDKADITSETRVAVMVGKKVKLSGTKPVVKYAGKALKLGKDYDLKYFEGSKDGRLIENPATEILSEAGKTYTIVITARQDSFFTGEMQDVVTVIARNPALTVNVTKLKVVNAAGKPIKLEYSSNALDLEALFDNRDKTPIAYVKNGKTVLTYGTDYTVGALTGHDYRTAGKHKYVIQGVEKEDPTAVSYSGNKTETLEITGAALGKVKIAGLSTSVEYTGKPITYSDLLRRADKNLEPDWDEPTLYYIDASKNKIPLTRSVDGVTGDYTMTFINDGNPGKATLELKGINRYVGTVKKTITIKAYNVKGDAGKRLVIDDISDVTFSKAGVKPSVTVWFITEWNTDGTIKNKIRLREGVDYTLSYTNNTKVADKTAKKAPNVVVKGIGNFTGSNATKTFTIVKAPITSAGLIASDIKYNAKGNAGYFFAVPKLYQDGKALAVGKKKDVEALDKKELEYTYAEDTVLGDISGTRRYDGEKVLPGDKILPGTKLRVSIKLSKLTCGDTSPFAHFDSEQPGDYIYGYFRVVNPSESISKYKVEVKNKNKFSFNSGDAIEIKESDIAVYRVVKKVREDVPVSDYRIKSVSNNRFLGTTVIVVEGVGRLNGTRSISVRLGAKPVFSN